MKCLILLMAAALLSACVPGSALADNELPALTHYLTEELWQKAVPWDSCDDRALAAVMRKAERGEDITVAVIGGSITEGTISNGSKDGEVPQKLAYAEIFRRWWADRFPQTKVNFVNAGIGGTDSYLGVHRLRMDVLSKKPDVVLVEYAVNDDGSKPLYIGSYDSLCGGPWRAKRSPPSCCCSWARPTGPRRRASSPRSGQPTACRWSAISARSKPR